MKKKISMNGLIKIVPLAILCIVTGLINPVFFAGSNLIRPGKIYFLSADRQCWSYVCITGGQSGYVDWFCYGAWGRNLRIVPRK